MGLIPSGRLSAGETVHPKISRPSAAVKAGRRPKKNA